MTSVFGDNTLTKGSEEAWRSSTLDRGPLLYTTQAVRRQALAPWVYLKSSSMLKAAKCSLIGILKVL